MSDFLIACFPRSRSLWLSHFLSIQGLSICTHESLEFAGSAVEFWDNADTYRLGYANSDAHYGDSDSAIIFVLPALLAERPMTKVVWIDRPIVEVCRSLKEVDQPIGQQAAELMLTLRDRYCDHFDLILDYHHLGREAIVKVLWDYVLPGIPFDRARFKRYNAQKISYGKDNPMLKKDTTKLMSWVNQELGQPVEREG
jgi:hypothetical protein